MQHRTPDCRARVEATRKLDFSAAQAWNVLGDFGNHTWVPSVRHADLVGQGVGAIRRLTTDAGVVDERLDAWDQYSMTYSYSIVGHISYPVEDYRVWVRVESLTSDSSSVRWRAEFNAVGIPVAEAENVMERVYISIGDWLEQELVRRFTAQA